MRKGLAILSALVLMLGAVAPCALADAQAGIDVKGSVLLGVNTELSTRYDQRLSPEASFAEAERTYDLRRVGSSEYRLLEPELPVPEVAGRAAEKASAPLFSLEERGGAVELVTNDYSTVSMVKLYEGVHCTVWGSVSDDPSISVTETEAREIAGEYDAKYSRFTDAFGSDLYDADGDGKLAIMCYDIDRNFASGNPGYSGYVAGFFWEADLISPDDSIGDIQFVPGCYTNGIDCIHIDTYPGMGDPESGLYRVSDCYSTLFHELQHMAEASVRLGHGYANYFDALPTFMNETFSLSAEYIVYGIEPVLYRMSHFNGSMYSRGTSLTCWGGTLSNYAQASLFGQYLRTRYAQLTGTGGESFYATLLGRLDRFNSQEPLRLAADLLGTSDKQLVEDFWLACWYKDGEGPHGFAGEDWADDIEPRLASFGVSAGNGGACFYAASKYTTVSSSNGLTLYDLTPRIPTLMGGACGESASWLREGDVLLIDGFGAVSLQGEAPRWGKPETVVIGEGITSVGAGTFCDSGTVGSVFLPRSLVEIEAGSFTASDVKRVYYPGTAAEAAAVAVNDTRFKPAALWNVGHTEHSWGDVIPYYLPTASEDGAGIVRCTECGTAKAVTFPEFAMTVTLDACGGTGCPKEIEYVCPHPIGELPVPVRENAVFLGWFTERIGGQRVTESAILYSLEPITLYAHWDAAVMYGDANGDGKVSALDLLVLKKYLAWLDVSIIPENADVNADGNINSLDLLRLKKYFSLPGIVLGER